MSRTPGIDYPPMSFDILIGSIGRFFNENPTSGPVANQAAAVRLWTGRDFVGAGGLAGADDGGYLVVVENTLDDVLVRIGG